LKPKTRALYELNGDAVNVKSTQANTVNKSMLDKLRCTATNPPRVTNTRRIHVEQLKDAGQTGWQLSGTQKVTTATGNAETVRDACEVPI